MALDKVENEKLNSNFLTLKVLGAIDHCLKLKRQMQNQNQTEIQELQEPKSVYTNVFKFSSMNKEEKLFHVGLLEKLIEKQKILYTRLSLSDDPDAKTDETKHC